MKTFRKRLISFLSAAVGGATGAIIGCKMDNQAKEIEETVPEAKVERVGEGIDVEFNSNNLFGFEATSLSDEAKIYLDKLVAILNAYVDTNIEVQGYTSDVGTKAYNMSLSKRHVGCVSAYLKSKGIAISRVKSKGFGESIPRYDNTTENGCSQNRRVEFLITANHKMKSEAEKETVQ